MAESGAFVLGSLRWRQEAVKELRDCVRVLRACAGAEREAHGPAIADAFDLDEVADRIAALLPPE